MQLDQLARRLGFAGLIPFIVFSSGTWITLPVMENAHQFLLTYAAVILSFMGAIHWGLAMSETSDHARLQLGASVIPALLGWVALLLPMLYGYLLLALCFAALCLADKVASDHKLVPPWYLPMRVVLTAVVVLCLIVAGLSVFVY